MVTQSEVDALNSQIQELQTVVTGQESRLVPVFTNLFRAFRSEPWSKEKRFAAVGAAARYLLLGKPIVVASLGAGVLLALHANALLIEQNDKLALQSYLSTTNSYLIESQRISQITPVVLDLLREIQTEANYLDNGRAPLSRSLVERIIFVSNTVRPYRGIVEAEMQSTEGVSIGILSAPEFPDIYEPIPLGRTEPIHPLFRWTRSILGFGDDKLDPLRSLLVPVLSSKRSPERGLLLQSLLSAGAMESDGLEKASFEYADGTNILATNARFPKRMRGVHLDGATISGSNLSYGELPFASMFGLKGDGANFDNSMLMVANFQGASLTRASFKRALLAFAKLRNADLSGADFSDAFFLETDLSGANLSGSNATPEQLASAILSRETTGLPAEFELENHLKRQGEANH